MDHFPMKNQERPPCNPQSGSIFIWLFILIGLFAALSWAMSQGSRTGTATLGTERAKLIAGEIIDYGRQIKDVVHTLRINGCDDTEISFVGASGTYANALAPTDGTCNVFGANGGKMRLPDFEGSFANDTLVFGSNYLYSAGPDYLGTSEPELTLVQQVDREVCGEINKLLNNPHQSWADNDGTTYPYWELGGAINGATDDGGGTLSTLLIPFQGDYTTTGDITYNPAMEFNGENYGGVKPPLAGCGCESDDECKAPAVYYFYNVLITR